MGSVQVDAAFDSRDGVEGSRAAKDAADRLLKWIVRNRLDRSPGPQAIA
jgi:hypothetical protein